MSKIQGYVIPQAGHDVIVQILAFIFWNTVDYASLF